MPSPENDPDRYSMKWHFAPAPPRLPELKDIERGERFTLRQNPKWTIGERLEYDKKKAAERSPGIYSLQFPGPIYNFETNVYKEKAPEWRHYRGIKNRKTKGKEHGLTSR